MLNTSVSCESVALPWLHKPHERREGGGGEYGIKVPNLLVSRLEPTAVDGGKVRREMEILNQ